jgi:hypothetical protein
VIFAYSNFRIPELPEPAEDLENGGPGLLDQSACRAPMLPSRDDGPVPDTSWRITEPQRAEVRRLHATGLSITKIAKLTGMAWSTAQLIIEAAANGAAEAGS